MTYPNSINRKNKFYRIGYWSNTFIFLFWFLAFFEEIRRRVQSFSLGSHTSRRQRPPRLHRQDLVRHGTDHFALSFVIWERRRVSLLENNLSREIKQFSFDELNDKMHYFVRWWWFSLILGISNLTSRHFFEEQFPVNTLSISIKSDDLTPFYCFYINRLFKITALGTVITLRLMLSYLAIC